MGETSALKEKWEKVFSGTRKDSVQEEILVVFNHGSHSAQRAPSSSTSTAPTQTDGRKPYRYGSRRGVSPSGLKGKRQCNEIFRGTCTEPSCDFWHPPVCLNHKSESGCKCGDRCNFLHTEAGGQPSKKDKERWRKRIGGFLEKDYSIRLCVP